MASPASRIVIIGAGIGGLTLALLLRRRGIIAEILEQAPELREVGAAVALAANGTRVLQHLDLGDGLAQASSEFTEIIHRDGRDGTRIAAHALGRQYREAFGAPVFGLHRIALQQLLAGAWGADHLHLGLPRGNAPGARQRHAGTLRVGRVVRRRPGGRRRRHALAGAPLDHRRRRAALLRGLRIPRPGAGRAAAAAARPRRPAVLDGARRPPCCTIPSRTAA